MRKVAEILFSKKKVLNEEDQQTLQTCTYLLKKRCGSTR